MSAPRYDMGAVRTIAEAMGTSPDAHDYVLTDTATGRVKGVYASAELAAAAFTRLGASGGLFVLTVLHPERCGCPEVAA